MEQKLTRILSGKKGELEEMEELNKRLMELIQEVK